MFMRWVLVSRTLEAQKGIQIEDKYLVRKSTLLIVAATRVRIGSGDWLQGGQEREPLAVCVRKEEEHFVGQHD